MNRLAGRRILIVEDDYYLAADLRRALVALDVEVVGPVGDLAAGLELARRERVDAAVLDVNLRGQYSFLIADQLSEAAVPYLFVTGYDGWALPEAYRDTPRISKPFAESAMVEMIGRLCGAVI